MVGEFIRERRLALHMSQGDLAEKLEMAQPQLSRLERGEVGLPQRATLEKLARALRTPLSEFYRAAGVLEGVDEDEVPSPPPPIQLPLTDPDEQFDPAAIVAYVESRPGVRFQARLRAQRERRSRDAYVRFCVSLFRAWSSNSYLALDAAEMSEQPR